MRAADLLRAKPACWLLMVLLWAPAAGAAAPPSWASNPVQTNRLAPSLRSTLAKPPSEAEASPLPAAPRPAPAYRSDLRPPFAKTAPASIADLKLIEQHVKALAARVSLAVVGVEIGSGNGSGVVISADGLVLSAGHVCGAPDRTVRFTFPNGKSVRGKTLGVNRDNDTGLMRITDRGPWPYAKMGDLQQTLAGDWVLALGHPGGFDLRRSLVVRLGRIIRLMPDALQTDCTISPGDSGGPLFDMHGRIIGIHSAISRSVAENFHVPITEYYDSWDALANGTAGEEQTFALRSYVGAPALNDAIVPRTLPRNRYRNGEETLQAFAPISEATGHSIVKLNVDGATVALGTVVDASGLALTKASELKKGRLTCWLATEKEVDAQVMAMDEEEDVALVQVKAEGLQPIQWATGEAAVGQWAITPGIAETPQAVGIISALPRQIRPPRALIGVQFEFSGSAPKIQKLLPGLGAEKAGLQPGDCIVAVNGISVTNREQVVERLREFREGQTVRLRLERAEKQFEAEVRLMALRADERGSEPYSKQRRSRLAGEVSQRAEGFEQAIEHDSVLQPWLCGGPLVNLEGQAIGLNIARASRVSTYALPARLVKRTLKQLKPAPKPADSTGK